MIPPTPEREKLLSLGRALLAAFLIVGAALVYWGVFRADALLARDDNPRVLEAELRLQRGSLIDSSGALLAYSEGTPERRLRRYPLPASGHAVGFYSIMHGTAGAEAGFDSRLRGEGASAWQAWWQQTLHEPRVGRDVQLALDSKNQESATAALAGHTGGALLLELPRGGDDPAWIRAMVSLPGYDANTLDETFEALAAAEDAPLLNRVTQGQYQPGLLLQPFILAAALDQGVIRLEETVEAANRPVRVNGSLLRCASPPPEPATWADALTYRCPAPMMELGDRLGIGGLDAAFANFALNRDPLLEIDTETAPDAAVADPLLAAIGQEHLSITPLQLGLAMAAFNGSGRVPQAQLGAAVANERGEWQPWRLEEQSSVAVSPPTSRAMRRAMPQENEIAEFGTVVLSGPGGSTNAWYTGIAAGPDRDYLAVVVLEESADLAAAQNAGRRLLATAQPY